MSIRTAQVRTPPRHLPTLRVCDRSSFFTLLHAPEEQQEADIPISGGSGEHATSSSPGKLARAASRSIKPKKRCRDPFGTHPTAPRIQAALNPSAPGVVPSSSATTVSGRARMPVAFDIGGGGGEWMHGLEDEMFGGESEPVAFSDWQDLIPSVLKALNPSREVYLASETCRDSVTCIEAVNTVGKRIEPMIIIAAAQHSEA
ncbi:unnamed protein product [Tilletia laevis]|uniref:Uncharacterized protein n=2 Tax=Tilletia TaxID=13289 RepID=A0A177T127_9BASI|nr:hypothetical protein CF335_g8773 [Tilletia laevis]KAE8187113.1 hypothetical protein CF336_g6704 [Tilletia laevis]KAE8240767.1 hypothetical protein A4X03_0g8380 [Tilletia caries]CAD6915682.1 unnamed protein product [Tilletia caries]CAD6951547.1 unnamed protein product [Tilletia laevis]